MVGALQESGGNGMLGPDRPAYVGVPAYSKPGADNFLTVNSY